MSKVMGIDPGDKRIGIAVSDETGSIATPLKVLSHIKREIDAAMISNLADELGVGKIIIGQALDDDGIPSPQGRKAARLAEAIRAQTHLPVLLWDESGSTREAHSVRLMMNANKKDRRGHLDALAATVILQTYLDAENFQK